ncbi:MAG: hypothetical protein JJU16_01510 [Alkalibacterium sp.]|nr:hypothetical protein [Alkalibacterium sp.]
MKQNDKLFKGILTVVSMLVIVGYGAIIYLSLDEPVFFRHDYDVEIYEGEGTYGIPFNLNYITNASDEREVIGIVFPDYPDLYFQATENVYEGLGGFEWDQPYNQVRGITYGHYTVRDVYLEIQSMLEIEELNDIVLSESTIYFSDSSEMTVDIGEIRLYSQKAEGQSLVNPYSAGSYDGVVETTYTINEDMSLSFDNNQNNELKAVADEILVNGIDVTDAEVIDMNSGDSFSVTTIAERTDNILQDYELKSYVSDITYTAEDGTENSLRLASLSMAYPEFNFLDLYRYLSARGEL